MKEIERATATFDVATAAAILGHLYAAEYWIEGMAEWHVLWAGTPPPPLPSVCYTDRPARVGEALHLAVTWINDSDVPIKGHVDIALISPSGVRHEPAAVENQDKYADPGSGWMVRFEPVTMDEAGTWTLEMALSGGASPAGEIERASAEFTVEPVAPPAVPTWAKVAIGLLVVGGLAYVVAHKWWR